jgi:hypothetical protein
MKFCPEYPNLPNEKFLGVQNPFYKKGFGRRRQSWASGGPADVSRAKLLKKFDQNFSLPFGR